MAKNLNERTVLIYRDYRITTWVSRMLDNLHIYEPNGVKSAIAPGTIKAAKRMIDRHIDYSRSIYDESGFKDANVIEPVAVVAKPEAVYSNKNWAA